MMVSRRRGAGGGLRIKKKARGFMCGCGGPKAVSISDGSDKQSPMATPHTVVSSTATAMSCTTTATTTKAARRARGNHKTAASSDRAPSSYYGDDSTTDDAHSSSVESSTPSLSALLRQLRDLERSVRFLQSAAEPPESDEGGAGGAEGDDASPANTKNSSNNNNGGGAGGIGGRRHRRTLSGDRGGSSGRVEESVAVVKESADPLGDFRRSMLQMIVEKEIVGGAELRELLHRFLSLNAPCHHHLILRAFADIWDEVFAGYECTPEFIASRNYPHSHRRHAHNNNNNKHKLQQN